MKWHFLFDCYYNYSTKLLLVRTTSSFFYLFKLNCSFKIKNKKMAEKRNWGYLMERRKSDSEGYLEAKTRWLTSSSILLFALPGFLLLNYYASLIHSYQQSQYCSYIMLWCCYQFKTLLNVPFTFAFITNFRYW